MYIWIILSMFITALYAFNLHVRSDSNALYVEPQAQMLISKIALQHDIETKFFSYVHEHVSAEMKLEEAIVECDESGTNEDGSCKTVSQYVSQAKKYVEEGAEDPFANDIAGQLGDYTRLSEIPLNFDVGDADNRNKDFIRSLSQMEGITPAKGAKSMAFCVKAKDITNPNPFESYYYDVCTSDKAVNCCYGVDNNDFNVSYDDDGNEIKTQKTGHERSGGALYVVTYAPLPVRWQQRDSDGVPTGMPNKDMIRAFRHFGETNAEFGYFVTKGNLNWSAESAKSDGSHTFFDGEADGEVRDIQTNAMTDYTVGDFTYFIQGFKDTPVGIPTIIGDEIEEQCTNPTCLVAISQVK